MVLNFKFVLLSPMGHLAVVTHANAHAHRHLHTPRAEGFHCCGLARNCPHPVPRWNFNAIHFQRHDVVIFYLFISFFLSMTAAPSKFQRSDPIQAGPSRISSFVFFASPPSPSPGDSSSSFSLPKGASFLQR